MNLKEKFLQIIGEPDQPACGEFLYDEKILDQSIDYWVQLIHKEMSD